MLTIKTLLVPVDFEPTSDRALSYGRELAGMFGARLHILHVVDDVFALSAGSEGALSAFPGLQRSIENSARSQVDERISDEDRQRGAVGAVLTSTSPAHAIVKYAQDAGVDLIVMGTHGRHGAPAALIGSVAERVVRTAACPVLTVGPAQPAAAN
jgi:nucleotide-binding universal stress UspA family protein